MKIIVVGASGTIGRAIADALSDHEIVRVSRSSAEHVDIADPASIVAMFDRIGAFDALVSAAGAARFKPLAELADDDFAFSLASKLMGQVNLVRYGLSRVRNGGSFTLTSGVLGRHPAPGSAAPSLVNAGLEGFVRAAALEAPRDIRVNVVSPPWVSETLTALGRDAGGGLPAAVVAQAYVQSVTGTATGQTIEPT